MTKYGRLVELAALVAVLAAGVAVPAITGSGDRRRAIAFFAGWLVPGSGHAILGRWRKGLFFFFLLGALYVFGLWLSGWRTVSWDDNPFYYVGQYGSGITSLLGWLLGDPKAFPRSDLPKRWFDPGLLYICVAGLLNLVVMLGIFDVKGRESAPVEATPGLPPAQTPQGEQS